MSLDIESKQRKVMESRDKKHYICINYTWYYRFDDHFVNREQYDRALLVLDRYNAIQPCDWETMEEFLMDLDPRDDHLLHNIIHFLEAGKC